MGNFFPLRYGTTVADGAQLVARIESLFFNTRDAGGNSNGFQRSALEESLHANTRHSIRDRDRLQKSATIDFAEFRK